MSTPEQPKATRYRSIDPNVSQMVLRATDQETARVVAVHQWSGEIVGAGCLVDDQYILTCRHVVAAALKLSRTEVTNMRGQEIPVTLAGVSEQPTVRTKVINHGGDGPENDLALLEIFNEPRLQVSPADFASPLRHGGKTYSVMGFPGGDPQGRNARGTMYAVDAKGLVQMDRGGALSVLGGFSGAPVWSPDVNAFVGLVVTELAKHDVSWCIPSRLICPFFPELRVRFRIPPIDRPVIHDYENDDPNRDIFGSVSMNNGRSLTARIIEYDDYYEVTAKYSCGEPGPQGRFVTFITYPDFEVENVDAYELFVEMTTDDQASWCAEISFEPVDLFTLAAVADGGNTVLTLDLNRLRTDVKPTRRRISNKPK